MFRRQFARVFSCVNSVPRRHACVIFHEHRVPYALPHPNIAEHTCIISHYRVFCAYASRGSAPTHRCVGAVPGVEEVVLRSGNGGEREKGAGGRAGGVGVGKYKELNNDQNIVVKIKNFIRRANITQAPLTGAEGVQPRCCGLSKADGQLFSFVMPC